MNKPKEIGQHSDNFDFSGVDIAQWLKNVSRRTRRGEVTKGCKIAAEKIEELQNIVKLDGNELYARLLDMTEALKQIAQEKEVGYGYYHGGDPRNFIPDSESCTEKEIAAHKKVCEEWTLAEKEGKPSPEVAPQSGWITPGIHVTQSSFGIGGYTYPTEGAEIAIKTLAKHKPFSE